MGLLSAMGLSPKIDAAALPPPFGAQAATPASDARLDAMIRAHGTGRFEVTGHRYFRVARPDRSLPWQQIVKGIDNMPAMQGHSRRLDWPNARDELTAVWSIDGKRGVATAAVDDGDAASFPVAYYNIRFLPGVKLDPTR